LAGISLTVEAFNQLSEKGQPLIRALLAKGTFGSKDILEQAVKVGLSKRTAYRTVQKAKCLGLLVSLERGEYRARKEGE
jgi:predicted transcriptional regulator YheO